MEKLLSKQEIDRTLAANDVSEDKTVWIKKVIPILAKQLLDEPIRYRTFGIFWWEIKRLLNQRDYYLGDNQEKGICDVYPEPYLQLAAGMTSAIGRIDDGNFDNRYVYQKENGEQFEYALEDQDMEMRMASRETEKELLNS
jgi:hypothetical protein